jgi:ADP-ribose pyrophosphatase YjhB (NUDIX family)
MWRSPPLLAPVIRIGMTGVFGLMRLRWFFTRPDTQGVQAVVFTPAGKVVLVRQSYTRQWMLPGGGVEQGETGADAAAREAREEMGLSGWTSVSLLDAYDRVASHRHVHVEVFVIRGARYRPRWSLEIEAIAEFAPDALPADCDAGAARMIGDAILSFDGTQ